jgi:hypothetical protein
MFGDLFLFLFRTDAVMPGAYIAICAQPLPSTRLVRSHKMEPMPVPLHTIRAAHTELGRSVGIALRTQMGDAARLGVQKQDCLRLLALTEQVGYKQYHGMTCHS